jgi:hypothetical protein
MFPPLMITTTGIVLRGASLAFRKAVVTTPQPSHLRGRVRHRQEGHPIRGDAPTNHVQPVLRALIRAWWLKL